MKPRRNLVPSQQDNSGLALAQGDLGVNLFIVLLVVLATLTVAQVSSTSEGYLTPYKRGQTEVPKGPPPLGWQPVLPVVYPKLIARKGQLHLLDMTGVARAFAAQEPMDLGADARDTSRMRENDAEPSAHTVFLRFYSDTVPAAISRASLPLSDVQTEEGNLFLDLLTDTPKVDLFVYPDDVVAVGSIMDALHNRGIAVRLVSMQRDDIFGFVYSGSDLGLEKTFK
ncbi:MAG: hypothetical protein AAF393_07470 [Pseudomonadota bacterium]